MTTPDKDKVASSTPADMEAAAEAAASVAASEGAHDAEVVADAEVIEANEAGQLDDELERAAADAVAGVIEESEVVAAAKAEAADWQDKYVRLHAEWDTYRRRMGEQREAEKARATEKLMESLLPVLDDFVRTVDYAEQNGETGLLGGVKAVQTKLVDTLAKGGLQVIDPAGEAFDALACQAVGTVDDPSVPDETVSQVYQLGYRMGDKVLRPAMVTITTGGPKREKPEDTEE
ncbi:nucleotide exchange factor GrpE [uncultured Adlercreutzia sp.]|uniref:nucleotide exchange factor GrpE n=1 Tax=uncultured Adlercreutzia sp. TaxID=875803 RepID=UPI0025E9FEA2|nr:nucleotide exchange factor GrpE [uncultured Adlercreutzia sp.]MCI9261505.1 nucleotide exchange factor GrpE [Eggerthellaceae bacterium]